MEKGRSKKESMENSLIPTATGSNTAKATSGQKKKKDQDVSKITCYSCNKKDYFASTCAKMSKTSYSLDNLHVGGC